jgi:hypothetical protein
MVVLTPTAAERRQGSFDAVQLQAARAALHEDGFVLIENVVAHEHLDLLRIRMEEDLLLLRVLPHVPHNFVWGNIQQDPPPTAAYTFGDVVANPFACQLTSSILGDGAYLNGISGNSNVPGSQRQPVHVDEGQLWPDLAAAHPPVRLAVNITLTDTTAANGAVELWPGSHADVTLVMGQEQRVPAAALADRRALAPPLQVETRKGAILVRDTRVWHRGTANTSADTRFMLAMVHNVAWLKRDTRCTLDRRCASLFDGCPIVNEIPLVDEPGDDYLSRNRPFAYDDAD